MWFTLRDWRLPTSYTACAAAFVELSVRVAVNVIFRPLRLPQASAGGRGALSMARRSSRRSRSVRGSFSGAVRCLLD